jgi:hypothetical protein
MPTVDHHSNKGTLNVLLDLTRRDDAWVLAT